MVQVSYPWRDWWHAFASEAELGRFDLGRYQAEYFAWGRGPALVCIHGVADNFLAFFPLVALLKDRFRIIAYNLPDGYRDNAQLEKYTLSQLCQDVVRVLHEMHLDSATLVGHSFGSALALATAYRYPHVVQRVVTICGFAHRPLRLWQIKLLRFGRLVPNHWTCRIPYTLPLRWALNWEGLADTAAHRSPDLATLVKRLNILPPASPLACWPRVSFRAWANWALKLAEVDLRPYLPSIRVPALIVYTKHDPLVPEHCQRELLEKLPQAIGFRLATWGHCPNWTHPHLLAEAIEQFHRMTDFSHGSAASASVPASGTTSPGQDRCSAQQTRPDVPHICPLLQSKEERLDQDFDTPSPGA